MVHAGAAKEKPEPRAVLVFVEEVVCYQYRRGRAVVFGGPKEVIAVGTSSNPECNEFTGNEGCAG